MRIDLIVCIDKNGKIGASKTNTIPWNLPDDLKYFKTVTTNTTKTEYKNVVIMGRNTWCSIPEKYRPLTDRINIVVSTTLVNKPHTYEDTYFTNSYESAIELTDTFINIDKTFVIGGSSLYKKALSDKRLRYAYVTHYNKTHATADVEFPLSELLEKTELISSEPSKTSSYVSFSKYAVPNKEEKAFQKLLSIIITTGKKSGDRTGTGTLSVFGYQLRYDLESSFPLMTSRKAYMRQILEEFKFIMSGSTDVSKLREKSVHIWDANTTREFLDSRGLHHLPEFDMGPTYGFAMRHYGATYKTCKDDYTNQGFDQLKYVVDTIKKDPTSRRIRISLWEPTHIHDVALTPCLNQFDFYVDEKQGTLSLLAFLRSSDTFLALMWNTTYCAIFCHVIAKLTGLRAGELIMNTANSHLYLNHVEQAKLQASRNPYPYPSACIMKDIETLDDIQKLEVADFRIRGYESHPAIKADMAV